jgi:hypothetical protein
MIFGCPCCALVASARSDSWRFCVILHVLAPCISLEWCAGISWLRGAGWRLPPIHNAPRSCRRGCVASKCAAKPESLRFLGVGSSFPVLLVSGSSSLLFRARCSVLRAPHLSLSVLGPGMSPKPLVHEQAVMSPPNTKPQTRIPDTHTPLATPTPLSLPRFGWLTVLKLTRWVRGTNPSTLERARARAHPIGELN